MKKTTFLLSLIFSLFFCFAIQGQDSNVLNNVTTMSKYSKNIGAIYYVKITGSKYGRLYGGYDGIYTDDSKLAAAAVHSGLLYVGETKTLRVKIVPGQNRYLGIKKNNLQSNYYSAWSGSYYFVDQIIKTNNDVTYSQNTNYFNSNVGKRSKDLNLDCNITNGTLQEIMLRKREIVFRIDSRGQISDIIIFNTESDASKYMLGYTRKPREVLREGNITFYTNNLNFVNYHGGSKHLGYVGKLKSFDKIALTYFPSYTINEGFKGKLKSIGYLNIEYHGSYLTKGYTGKIKSIGNTSFKYFGSRTEFFNGYGGKIKSIGQINFRYFGNYKSFGNKGKLTSIGNIKFRYYSDNWRDEGHKNKFRSKTGTDNRFSIF
tara:strand:+ start:120 stop:1241 length:1122 start_codon:yes stop_codon:yes gene_type:complete